MQLLGTLACEGGVEAACGGQSFSDALSEPDGDLAIDDIGEASLDVVLGFLQQSWADSMPGLAQLVIAVLFNLAIVFLVSDSTALTIAAIVAAVIAFIEALVPG
jgi:hypothetical protein